MAQQHLPLAISVNEVTESSRWTFSIRQITHSHLGGGAELVITDGEGRGLGDRFAGARVVETES